MHLLLIPPGKFSQLAVSPARSLIMLQYPIQYQLILPSIYNTCQAELLLETKASTLCPKDHSTNLCGFKVSSNIDVTSDVQEPICVPKWEVPAYPYSATDVARCRDGDVSRVSLKYDATECSPGLLSMEWYPSIIVPGCRRMFTSVGEHGMVPLLVAGVFCSSFSMQAHVFFRDTWHHPYITDALLPGVGCAIAGKPASGGRSC